MNQLQSMFPNNITKRLDDEFNDMKTQLKQTVRGLRPQILNIFSQDKDLIELENLLETVSDHFNDDKSKITYKEQVDSIEQMNKKGHFAFVCYNKKNYEKIDKNYEEIKQKIDNATSKSERLIKILTSVRLNRNNLKQLIYKQLIRHKALVDMKDDKADKYQGVRPQVNLINKQSGSTFNSKPQQEVRYNSSQLFGAARVNQNQPNQMQQNQMRTNQMQSNQMQQNQMRANQMQSTQMQQNQMRANEMQSTQMRADQMQHIQKPQIQNSHQTSTINQVPQAVPHAQTKLFHPTQKAQNIQPVYQRPLEKQVNRVSPQPQQQIQHQHQVQVQPQHRSQTQMQSQRQPQMQAQSQHQQQVQTQPQMQAQSQHQSHVQTQPQHQPQVQAQPQNRTQLLMQTQPQVQSAESQIFKPQPATIAKPTAPMPRPDVKSSILPHKSTQTNSQQMQQISQSAQMQQVPQMQQIHQKPAAVSYNQNQQKPASLAQQQQKEWKLCLI